MKRVLSKGLVSGQDFWAKAHIALVFVTSTECGGGGWEWEARIAAGPQGLALSVEEADRRGRLI